MIELDERRCVAVLEETDTAHLACIADGEPYVTPMSFVMIDGVCYLRTAPGRRVTALRAEPRVCVEVSRPTAGDGWESVIFWGEAQLVDDAETKADVIAALIRKYRAPALAASITTVLPAEHPVIAVTPERLTGRASGGGFEANTNPGRL
jgi:nitroimidazol reductase NimA-like FMN-containing flavoprotein (pyridoxamine 5'-phosphate oxidase superfamily)